MKLTVVHVLISLVILALFLWLLSLLIRALRKYLCSAPARQEKAEDRRSLGVVLKAQRLRCRMTQEFVAETLGVSRQAVSKWEGDLSRPAAGKLALLSETLDIPWDAWQAMDAEEAAAQAAARETEGERRARKWRRGSAALAALL